MKQAPDAVIHGVAHALEPGGRFVAEMGGFGNVAAITVALCAALANHGVNDPASCIPWYFSAPDDYRERLERAFHVEHIALIPRPTPLPAGTRGWLETFAIPFSRTCRKNRRGLRIMCAYDFWRGQLKISVTPLRTLNINYRWNPSHSERQSCWSWRQRALPVAAHTSKRTWPEFAWHRRRYRAQSCLRRELERCL